MTKRELMCGLPDGRVTYVRVDPKDCTNEVKHAIIPGLAEPCRTFQLDLFATGVAGTNDRWLNREDEASRKQLERALITRRDPLSLHRTVKDVFDKAPESNVIHLLMKVNTVEWAKADGLFPPLAFDENPIVRIPGSYVAGSGLIVEDRDLLLYRRAELVEEWQALQSCVGNSYAELWIVGPPGSGKSCAAFAFACSLDRTDWDVVWIHRTVGDFVRLKCILLRGTSEKWTCTIGTKYLPSLLALMKGNTLVFVDGYIKETINGDAVRAACAEWRYANEQQHRLVWVSSMLTRGKDYHPCLYGRIPTSVEETITSNAVFGTPTPKSEMLDEELFKLASWTPKDYEHAMANDDFFESVKPMLTESGEPVSQEERKTLLEKKLFIAGGNVLYMFGVPFERAAGDLDYAMEAAGDIEGHLTNKRGISVSGVVSRLFSWYFAGCNTTKALLSRYVARKLAMDLGPEFVQTLARSLAGNPSLEPQEQLGNKRLRSH